MDIWNTPVAYTNKLTTNRARINNSSSSIPIVSHGREISFADIFTQYIGKTASISKQNNAEPIRMSQYNIVNNSIKTNREYNALFEKFDRHSLYNGKSASTGYNAVGLNYDTWA